MNLMGNKNPTINVLTDAVGFVAFGLCDRSHSNRGGGNRRTLDSAATSDGGEGRHQDLRFRAKVEAVAP